MDLLNSIKRLFVSDSSVKNSNNRYMTHQEWLTKGYPQSPVLSDTTMNAENSLAISYVYAAINGISSDLATIMWPVIKNEGNRKSYLKDHDVWRLLNERSYFAYSSFSWKRALIANYLATGDGFSEIIRDKRTGRPRGLRLWHKKDINIYVDYETEQLQYEITCDNNRIVQHYDMLHLSDMNYNGFFGYSKIGLAQKALQIYKRSDDTQKEVQENATMLSGYVKIDGTLDSDLLKRIRESFNSTYGGAKGGVAVMDGGMTFTPFDYTMNLADAEFITSRKHNGEEILRWFRYPAHMAGMGVDRMTDNNLEQLTIGYVNFCLRPIMVMVENEVNSKLLMPKEKANIAIKGSLKDLLRGDIQSRMIFIETMWKIGAFTPNMALEFEDMNPIENGDMSYSDLNKVPAHLVEEYYKSKIDKNNE